MCPLTKLKFAQLNANVLIRPILSDKTNSSLPSMGRICQAMLMNKAIIARVAAPTTIVPETSATAAN